jgi:hypothetical protein
MAVWRIAEVAFALERLSAERRSCGRTSQPLTWQRAGSE